MKCFLHFIVDQAGTKSDSWQLGKVRLTGTQTVKEDPVAKECLAQSCNWYQGLEGQNIWNSGSQLGQICTPMSRTFLVVTLGGGGATSKQWVETRDAAKIDLPPSLPLLSHSDFIPSQDAQFRTCRLLWSSSNPPSMLPPQGLCIAIAATLFLQKYPSFAPSFPSSLCSCMTSSERPFLFEKNFIEM